MRKCKCIAIGCVRKVARPKRFCNRHWKLIPIEAKEILCDVYKNADIKDSSYTFGLYLVHTTNALGIYEKLLTAMDALQRYKAYRAKHRLKSTL